MRVKLDYGRTGLDVDLPERTDIIEPKFVPGLSDELGILRDALRNPIASPPLADLVSRGDTVVVVHTDITRATPNDRILPEILKELEFSGVRREDIILLNGLGTHRKQTEAELRAILGNFVVDNYKCRQHDCDDSANLVWLGHTGLGHPVRINRAYMEADVKLLTGLIEPHFFAGFSGGPKAILPSLAGAESVFSNHGLEMIAHKNARWGVLEGNPIWEEMRAVALMTEPDFLVNVTLNSKNEITGVFAGNMLVAHAQGAAFCREVSMVKVDDPYDIVITTNSGYPLDQNLYQSVKGMSTAAQILKPGGSIVLAAACEDGLPAHGLYSQLLKESKSPKGVLEKISQPGFNKQDQWQVQIQAQIQLKADVFVYSEALTDAQISDAQLIPIHSIEDTLSRLVKKIGPSARICAIPEGPLVIPYLAHLNQIIV